MFQWHMRLLGERGSFPAFLFRKKKSRPSSAGLCFPGNSQYFLFSHLLSSKYPGIAFFLTKFALGIGLPTDPNA